MKSAFGPVEGGLAGGLLVGQVHLVEHRADVVLGPPPGLAGGPLYFGSSGSRFESRTR